MTLDEADPRARLDAIRLDEDLTWRALAADIFRITGFTLSPATLYAFVKQDPRKKVSTRDRTLHKITRYLQTRKATVRRRPAGRARVPEVAAWLTTTLMPWLTLGI
jgi:hypothetical protein